VSYVSVYAPWLPTDTLKVRLQTQSHTNPIYSGLSDCVKKTWAAEGAKGFYKGVASPLVGQMFFNAVQVSSEYTQRHLR
jgi:solute carrier family 25 carnitine/acylcarnitine transporter 20/29